MPDGPFPPARLDELVPAGFTLPTGSLLFRVHWDRLDANEFNPHHGSGARFHFVHDASGRRAPALYAAASPAAAVAETIFHEVPVRPKSDRRVAKKRLEQRLLSWFRTRKDLELVELHHPGLGHLNLEPRDLTDTDSSEYPRTRAWAQALHDHGDHEGLVWMSRLHNTDEAYTFFGDRVTATAFEDAEGSIELWHGPGLELIYRFAEAAGITIVHP